MEKTFHYHQQIFAGLKLEIYNDLLKKDKIFLQCIVVLPDDLTFILFRYSVANPYITMKVNDIT